MVCAYGFLTCRPRGSVNDIQHATEGVLMEEILHHFNALLNFKTPHPVFDIVATVQTANWDK